MPTTIVGASSGQMSIQDASDDTRSIAAILTQTTGSGSNTGVRPNKTGLPEFYWSFTNVGGSGAGNFYINRNDPQGLAYWTQAYTGYPIGFDQFYNYDHWSDKHYYDGQISVTSPFAVQVDLSLDDSFQGPSTYMSNTYSTGPGQSLTGGLTLYNYQHTYPNTPFNVHQIRLTSLAPPGPMISVNTLDVTDLDTGATIASFGGGTILAPGAPKDFNHKLPFNGRYYITINIA